MGIRYYAYPIAADDYLRALEDPWPFHGSDPLMDAWGTDATRPEMLYLDKCWRELQGLLGASRGEPFRAAFQLVKGQVTHVEDGWIPFEHALSPAQVQSVAEDLATVTDEDITRLVGSCSACEDPDSEHQYVAQFLAAAQEFTARLAADGRSLVYLIG